MHFGCDPSAAASPGVIEVLVMFADADASINSANATTLLFRLFLQILCVPSSCDGLCLNGGTCAPGTDCLSVCLCQSCVG